MATEELHSPRVLIAGCGDVGSASGLLLAEQGARVQGLRRRPEGLPAAIQGLQADLRAAEELRRVLRGKAFDYVISCAAAGEFSDEAYRAVYVQGLANLLQALAPAQAPRRIFLVSSTRVYCQDGGEWVDEDSPTAAEDFAGRRLLQAEELLRDCGWQYTVVRCAGIYGPGRLQLLRRVRAGQGCRREPPLYSNRIHRDDCAGILAHLLLRDWRGEAVRDCYLAVDCEPAPLWEVMAWIGEQVGVTLRESGPEGTRGRRRSRRMSNRRLRESGYVFRCPDYRSGYAELLAGEEI